MVNNKIVNKTLSLSLKEKILKLLIENKNPRTILQIAENLKVDYKNTFQAVNKLYPDLIYKDKMGNLNIVEIKLTPSPEIYSVEDKRAKQFLHENKELFLIRKDIESLNYPFFIVLTFGSIVKKTNTKKSDIDVCIISDNKLKTHELMSKLRLLPLNLEMHNFSVSEFEAMLGKKENNLANEIIKNNIILFGIDNYYNLVSKWMKKE
jgi:predicted nucleotidyltransferase